MKVQAKSRGLYQGRLRNEGDEFELVAAGDFGNWMQPIDKSAEKAHDAMLSARAENARKSALVKEPVLAFDERLTSIEHRLSDLEAGVIDLQESKTSA